MTSQDLLNAVHIGNLTSVVALLKKGVNPRITLCPGDSISLVVYAAFLANKERNPTPDQETIYKILNNYPVNFTKFIEENDFCFCGKLGAIRGKNSGGEKVFLCDEHYSPERKISVEIKTDSSISRAEAMSAFAKAGQIADELDSQCKKVIVYKCHECGQGIGSDDKRYACQAGCNYDACEDCFQKLENGASRSVVHDHTHKLHNVNC